ncbi:MAG: SDR family NAD(P)-dependent oxidoreductase, partial [Kangiellaceae bacterium]|nr:SDR family NAD(P)-dependent oxidoreductase [Kangiellaceae bacterium]
MNNLKQIYLELSNGKISQREAFERIKKVKLNKNVGPASVKENLNISQPLWKAVYIEDDVKQKVDEMERVLLLGYNENQLNWLRASYKNVDYIPFSSDLSMEAVREKIARYKFDQLVWIAPDVGEEKSNEFLDITGTIDLQEKGVLLLFKAVKAILELEEEYPKLNFTLITNNTQKVRKSDRVQPAHAGVLGFSGSLAKELPNWNIRLLDIDSPDKISFQKCMSTPWDKKGNALAVREGEWYSQGLAATEMPKSEEPSYKQGGVYIVIGGAGGIGEVWTHFMVKRFNANIIWIGRRKINDAIQSKIRALGTVGREPEYIQADARNFKSLENVIRGILKKHPKINGVVHSAIVLKDKSVKQMDEVEFKASLSAKVDISINIAKIFRQSDLDFLLFFSSVQSFTKAAGQANYAAGCTFKDSLAQKLTQDLSFPIKTVNWGYWGNVGVVADDSYRTRMEQLGVGSIEPLEGMSFLQSFISSSIDQISLVKTLKADAIQSISLPERIAYYPDTLSSATEDMQAVLRKKKSIVQASDLSGGLTEMVMDKLVGKILASSLAELGIFIDGKLCINEFMQENKAASFYQSWLKSSVNYLQQHQLVNSDFSLESSIEPLNNLWLEWDKQKALWNENSNLVSHVALVEACLRSLPGILSGNEQATRVMFPDSSMVLVEGVYKNNALADYFNSVLADSLSAYLTSRLKKEKDCKIRILEVGAGTGGTTAKLIPIIKQFENTIAEYCYTDLSKAFLMHAEEKYSRDIAALTTEVLDIS